MCIIPEDAIRFLGELALNNDREWFASNKKRYESCVKAPMEALAAELIPRMQEYDPEIAMTPKEAVFRIYRDIRFSKDKSPYKTNAGLHVNSGGKAAHGRPGVYVHLDAKCFGIASGYYFLEPPQIAAMRRHLMTHQDALQKQLANKDFLKLFGGIRGEANKVLPTEFKDAAKDLPLLANKQFYYWAEYEPDQILRSDLPDFIMQHVKACWPMSTFLAQAFG